MFILQHAPSATAKSVHGRREEKCSGRGRARRDSNVEVGHCVRNIRIPKIRVL